MQLIAACRDSDAFTFQHGPFTLEFNILITEGYHRIRFELMRITRYRLFFHYL